MQTLDKNSRKVVGDGSPISVDTPAPFRVSDVIAYIDEQLGKLERTRVTVSYRRLKARVETLVGDKRYNFMFGGLTVQDTMTDVLSRLFRVPIDGRPISVIDLSTVPHEMLDVVVVDPCCMKLLACEPRLREEVVHVEGIAHIYSGVQQR